MNFWDNLSSWFNRYFSLTTITPLDIVEIIIIAFLFYEVLVWFKKTRAWALFKGIVLILVAVLIAAIFNFSTILWLASKILSVGVIAIFIIFQPELRKSLEQLGRKRSFLHKFFTGNSEKLWISDKGIEEVLMAVVELSRTHTGALICIEEEIDLDEYTATGINIDSAISTQLLNNIFIDKTPLHDGAVIIKEDRIAAATCYLPLSSNQDINKRFGTRHRAGVGLSEVSDAFVIIVSEETGSISLALSGKLIENVSTADLKNRLLDLHKRESEGSLFGFLKKGRKNDEVQGDTSEVGDK